MLKLTVLDSLILNLQIVQNIANEVGSMFDSEMEAAVDARNYERIEDIVGCKFLITKEVYVHVNLIRNNSSSFSKKEYMKSLNRICLNKGFNEPLTINADTDDGYW